MHMEKYFVIHIHAAIMGYKSSLRVTCTIMYNNFKIISLPASPISVK